MNITDLIVDNEIPTGNINGLNKTFILSYPPDPACSLEFYINGVLQVVDEDYSLDDVNIVLIEAPVTNSIIKASYRYSAIIITGSKLKDGSVDFNNKVSGTEKPADNATKNDGVLADKDSADFATEVSGTEKPADNATKNTVTTGSEVPTGGTNGDLYFRTTSKQWWAKLAGVWTKVSDETASNTAASIASQGALATKNTVGTVEIDDDAVNVDKINVATLSSISADIGTITAGIITGLIIQTHAAANTGIKLGATELAVYGKSIQFYDTSGAARGCIYGAGVGGGSQMRFEGTVAFDNDIEDACGFSGDVYMNWAEISSIALIDIKITKTLTAQANSATHYVVIDVNGTNYKLLLKSI